MRMTPDEANAMAKKLRELTEGCYFMLIIADRKPGAVFADINSVVWASPAAGAAMIGYVEEKLKPEFPP